MSIEKPNALYDFVQKTTATTVYGAGSHLTRGIVPTATAAFAGAYASLSSIDFGASFESLKSAVTMPFNNPNATLTSLTSRLSDAHVFVKDAKVATAMNAWSNFKATAPFILGANVVYQITGQVKGLKESKALRIITSLALTTLGSAAIYTAMGTDASYVTELMKASHLTAEVTASGLMWNFAILPVGKLALNALSKMVNFVSFAPTPKSNTEQFTLAMANQQRITTDDEGQ